MRIKVMHAVPMKERNRIGPIDETLIGMVEGDAKRRAQWLVRLGRPGTRGA